MGIEFTITKDIATVSATIAELDAVDRVIREEIGPGEFLREYDSLLSDVLATYRVVVETLAPLAALATGEDFRSGFAQARDHYDRIYQSALSEPRVNAEYTYEKYLQFRKLREVNTGYPPLKRTFARLHDFIDKWIDNDIWLAMTIDTLMKLAHRLLGEVAEVKKADADSAFQLYRSSLGALPPFLQLVESKLEVLEQRLEPAALRSGAASPAMTQPLR